MRSAAWNDMKLMSSNYPQTAGKRIPLNCEGESAADYFFSSRAHESWSGIFKACNPLVCLLGLVFDTTHTDTDSVWTKE